MLDRITCRLRLKVETPVHIGGGENAKFAKYQYIYDEEQKKIHIINEAKFAVFLFKRKLADSFESFLKGAVPNQRRAAKSLHQWLKENRVVEYEYGQFVDCSFNISLPSKQKNEIFYNEIFCLVKNPEMMPYLPGSGIKGSLRTALLGSRILEQRESYSADWNRFLELLNKKNKFKETGVEIANAIEKKTFNLLDFDKENPDSQCNSVMRGIAVSDTSAAPAGSIFIAHKKDLVPRKDTNTLPILREYLRPGTLLELRLTIDPFYTRQAGINNFNDIKERLRKYNSFLLGCPNSPYVLYQKHARDQYKYNLDLLTSVKSPLICLGGGVGFHAKSLLYHLAGGYKEGLPHVKGFLDTNPAYKEHSHRQKDIEASPRALKLVEFGGKNYLPGWCSLEEV